MRLELLDATVTLEDRTVRARVRARVAENDGLPRECALEVARGPVVVANAVLTPRLETEGATVGQDLEWSGEVRLSRFVPGGTYEVRCGPCGAAFGDDTTMRAGEVTVVVPATDYPRAEVRPLEGGPALYVDGRPVFPLIHMSCPIDPSDITAAAADGIHLETLGVASGWAGIDKYDYADTDRAIQRALEADPDSLLLLRVATGAPSDWLDAHPDEIVGYCDPKSLTDFVLGGPRHESFASTLWRRDATEAFRRLVRHIREAGYADRVLGLHVAGGIYGEWHYWNAPYYPDTSPAALAGFREWLAARGVEGAATATIPTLDERRHGDLGVFRDPVKSARVVSYSRFLHEQGAASLEQIARAVKEESGGRALVIAFNGYLPDLGWNSEGDHRRFDLLLRSPYIDGFASPHSYGRRAPGQDATMRGFPESVRAMGKLWFDEEDDRTSLAHDPTFTHVKTIEESVELLWRGFAQALTHGCALWYMDQQGGWYRDPAIHAAFARMRQVGEKSLARPRTRSSEVAVFASFENAFYLADRPSGLDRVTNDLINAQIEQLATCGAPFDLYLMSELLEPTVPDYRVYVFLDTFYMTDEQLAAIEALRERGKTLLFFYAPGFVSPDRLSLDRMVKLLGMPVDLTESMLLPSGAEQRPGFVPRGATGPVASAGTVRYCPAPPLPAVELARLFREAGAHLYAEPGDPLLAGCGYVALHAASAGTKTLRSPQRARWVDERTGTELARDATEVSVSVERGRTVLLRLDPPDAGPR
jgi:hypothetical protein